jgi:xylitol oxidase
VEALQKLVRSRDKLKALGSRHSFNGIADTTGDQVSLEQINEITLDAPKRTVRVGAGVRYGDLARVIDAKGYAVHNLASLPHVTVAGACATATHGSGVGNGNLSTAVTAIEFVTPAGDLVQLSRAEDPEHFAGAVVALGALGVITRTTLHVVPTFQMRQVVYENLPFDQLQSHLDEILSAGYSVSLFTDWQNHRATQVWIKSVVDPKLPFELKPTFFGATAAKRNLHPLAGHSAENCTEQLGIPGPWYERLPHFRMNFTPSSGAELQSEFFVPRNRGYEAMLAVEELRDRVTPHLFISEIRTIAADDLWMSPCYQRDSLAIHFTWKPEWTAVKSLLPLIEAKLAPFDARPHWAKLFTMDPQRLRSLYPRLADFQALAAKHDPQGKLRNAFLDQNVYKT